MDIILDYQIFSLHGMADSDIGLSRPTYSLQRFINCALQHLVSRFLVQHHFLASVLQFQIIKKSVVLAKEHTVMFTKQFR